MVNGYFRIRLRRKLALGLVTVVVTYSPILKACVTANETMDSLINCLINRSSELKSKKEIADTFAVIHSAQFGLQTPYFYTDLTKENFGYTNDEVSTLTYDSKESTTLDLGVKGRSLTLGLDYSFSLLKFNEQQLQSKKWFQTAAEASLKLNLLKGAGYYAGDIQAKELELEFNFKKQDFEVTKLNELRSLVNAYVDYSLIQRQIEILDSIVEGHDQRVKSLRSLESIGRASGLNLLSAQAQHATIKVEQARLKQENYRLKQVLCEILNLNFSECKIQKLKPLDVSDWLTKNPNLDQLVKKERDSSILKLKKLDVDRAELEVADIENESRSELDLIFKKQLKSNISEESQIHYARNGYEDVIGISYTRPFDTKLNDAKVMAQKAERNKLVRDYKKIQMQNELSIGLASQIVSTAKLEYSIAEERLKYSQERLNTATSGHKSGSVNLKDLLDYESEQKEAALQFEQSKSNLTKSVLDFLYLNQESQIFEIVKSF